MRDMVFFSGFSRKLTADCCTGGEVWWVSSVGDAAELRNQTIENSISFRLAQVLEESLHRDAAGTVRWLKKKDDPLVKNM